MKHKDLKSNFGMLQFLFFFFIDLFLLRQASCDCLRLLLLRLLPAGSQRLIMSVPVSALKVQHWLSFTVSAEACGWGCQWGCPVPAGSRPPGCPPPRGSGGPGSAAPAAAPSCRSRSSTPGPCPRRRAQTAGSCQPPVTQPARETSVLSARGMTQRWRYRKYLSGPTGFGESLTSCVLKNCDCSSTERSSSSRCR